MSQDCCSMTLLTFRPLSTSQLATLSMSTSTSQSVELVVDVNVAVSGASCRQRLSVSSVVTPFLMTSHSVLRRRQNWRHISIFILKLYHIWITLSLVLQCCTSDFVSLSLNLLSLSLSLKLPFSNQCYKTVLGAELENLTLKPHEKVRLKALYSLEIYFCLRVVFF